MVDPAPYSVFKTVFLYSAFILLAPITSFFCAKYFLFEGIFNTEKLTSNVSSAILAVVILHIGLGLFIYKAYFDGGKTKLDEKVD